MTMLALDTGLFTDVETLKEAVAHLPKCQTVELQPAEMSDADWDSVLSKILAADKIITI